jgi:hypothetical protein
VDSGVELLAIAKLINAPALFWLDGHYSAGVTAKGEKETPIVEELTGLLKLPEKRHVIIVDDARCFDTDPAYPKLSELLSLVKSIRPDMDVKIQDDSIRLSPNLEVK